MSRRQTRMQSERRRLGKRAKTEDSAYSTPPFSLPLLSVPTSVKIFCGHASCLLSHFRLFLFVTHSLSSPCGRTHALCRPRSRTRFSIPFSSSCFVLFHARDLSHSFPPLLTSAHLPSPFSPSLSLSLTHSSPRPPPRSSFSFAHNLLPPSRRLASAPLPAFSVTVFRLFLLPSFSLPPFSLLPSLSFGSAGRTSAARAGDARRCRQRPHPQHPLLLSHNQKGMCARGARVRRTLKKITAEFGGVSAGPPAPSLESFLSLSRPFSLSPLLSSLSQAPLSSLSLHLPSFHLRRFNRSLSCWPPVFSC